MLTLREIVIRLFPNKSGDNIRQTVVACEKSLDIDEAAWSLVTKDDLLKIELQLRIIRTVFDAQTPGETGVVMVIMDSIEIWSQQTLIFVDWPEDSKVFYTRLYALCGAQFFPELGYVRQQFLLHSGFLPLMIALGEGFYDKVKVCFAEYCYVNLLSELQDQFRNAIKTNTHQLVNSIPSTISEIINSFENFKTEKEDKVGEYIQSRKELNGLVVVERKMISNLLYIYDDISQGHFLHAQMKPLCAHRQTKNPKSINADEEYITILQSMQNITDWLKDGKATALWLSKKPELFVKNIVRLIKRKVDLKDDHQLQTLIKFIEFFGATSAKWSDILYFNEKDATFHWNEDLLK